MNTTTARTKTEEKVDTISQTAHDTLDTLDEKAKAGIEAGRRKAMNAVSAVEDFEAQAELTIEETTAKVTKFVQENPLQAAGIAFAAGVLTTMIMRKR